MGLDLSGVLTRSGAHELALIEVGEKGAQAFTYGELNDRINAIGRGLLSRFNGRPFNVAVLSRNSADFVALYFAVMRAGGTVAPFNWRAGMDAIDYFLKDASIDLVVSDGSVQATSATETIVFGSEEWKALLDPGPLELREVSDEAIAQILYTSGSTGRPKGVPLTHAGQAWAVEEAAKMVPNGGTYRVVVAAPLFHMNALFNLKRSFYSGAAIVLLPSFTPAMFAQALSLYKGDWVTGVPTMIGLLAKHLGNQIPREFAGVRRVFIGSAPYSEALFASVRGLFPNANIFNAYGTTEAGPTVFGGHPDGLPTPVLSCGYPIFPQMVKLVTREGLEIHGEGEGSLWMRTPATMSGYLNRPEATSEVMKEDWYDSRDVMRRDSNGFFYFIGRADDMFNSGGENIYPAEVETVLEQHPAIEQAVVVPVPDEVKFHLPVAFVVVRGGQSLDEEEVKAWFIQRAAPHLHPRRIFVLEEIPLAQTNKVDRTSLKAKARTLFHREMA